MGELMWEIVGKVVINIKSGLVVVGDVCLVM